MATITIEVDEKSSAGKQFLVFVKTLPFVSVVESSKLSGIDKALDDIKHNRVYTAKNTKDLMQKTTK